MYQRQQFIILNFWGYFFNSLFQPLNFSNQAKKFSVWTFDNQVFLLSQCPHLNDFEFRCSSELSCWRTNFLHFTHFNFLRILLLVFSFRCTALTCVFKIPFLEKDNWQWRHLNSFVFLCSSSKLSPYFALLAFFWFWGTCLDCFKYIHGSREILTGIALSFSSLLPLVMPLSLLQDWTSQFKNTSKMLLSRKYPGGSDHYCQNFIICFDLFMFFYPLSK